MADRKEHTVRHVAKGRMSGFFQGPPLLVHVLIAAGALGFVGPWLIPRAPSRGLGFALVLGLAALYLLLALLWGSRRLLLSRRRRLGSAGKGSGRDGNRSS